MTTHNYLHRLSSLLILISLSLTSIAYADSKPKPLAIINVSVNDQVFSTEVADTEASRTLGLSDRPMLAPNHAMLFAFAHSGPVTFWMIKMNFPLDIIWLDSDKHVIGLVANADACIGSIPCTLNAPLSDPNACQPGLARSFCPLYPSPTATRYVLEVNAGTAEKLHIEKGTAMHFDVPNA